MNGMSGLLKAAFVAVPYSVAPNSLFEDNVLDGPGATLDRDALNVINMLAFKGLLSESSRLATDMAVGTLANCCSGLG